MENARKRLKQAFKKHQGFDLKSIMEQLPKRSRRSIFRDLNSLGYLSSYTHTGRYYTIMGIPHFDDHGLWFFRGVGFSRSGTLKASVVELVNNADAGRTHKELAALLRIRVHNTLLTLVQSKRISRNVAGKRYLYVSTESKRAIAQLARRHELISATPEPLRDLPENIVIEVLLEVIHATTKIVITPAKVVERLKARGVSLSVEQVAHVFESYGLEPVKKTAGYHSRP